DSLHHISFDIPVERNDSTMVVRLYGNDYFGFRSSQYSEVLGKGYESIGYGPIFDKIAMVSAKEVAMSWSMLEEFEDMASSFTFYTADSWGGEYEVDTVGVASDSRFIIRPVTHPSTYFRIAAVDAFGNEYSSFPQLVTQSDTIAPVIPTNFSYT